MCKRNTTDPLVRMFLDRYKVNLLAVPRQGADCGEVYIRNGRRVSSGVGVTDLLEPAVTLPAAYRGEPLANLSGSFSDAVGVKLGIGLLESFMAAIGVAAVLSKVSALFERTRTSGLRFSFADATRDSIDAASLGLALGGRRLRPDQPLVQPGNEYFVTAAVIRSPSVSVIAEDDRANRVEFGADAVTVLNATAGVNVESGASGQLTFRGDTPLAIGLELYELTVGGAAVMGLAAQDPGRPVHAGKTPPPQPTFVAPDDDALLALAEDAASALV